MGFQFGDYNLRIEGVSYQKIGIMGLVLVQITLRIVLKIYQSTIVLACTLWERMEKEHTESKDSHNVRSWHQQSPKNILMFPHSLHKHHQCYVVLKRTT